MARKTRKEKTKARERRSKIVQAQSQNSSLVKGEFEFRPERLKGKPREERKLDKSILLYDAGLVRRDLVKTVLLALGIFSLEIVIYLSWFK